MASIITKKYLSKTFNVPFYERSSESYKLRMKVGRANSADEIVDNNANIRDAAHEFITSYLPEFYSALYDEEYFTTEAGGDLDLANEIRLAVQDSITVNTFYQTSPPSNKTVVIFRSVYDFDNKREELLFDGTMPDFDANLAFFNEQQNIEGEISETTLTVGTLGSQNDLLNNGLKTFDTQYGGFEGQIDINVAFGPLQLQATGILNLLVTILSKQLKTQNPNYDFSEADTITIVFGKKRGKLAVSRIDYLLIEDSIESQPLRVGYFSIIKNNKLLKDPLTLAILRNYQNLLSAFQGAQSGLSPYSFFDFLNDDSVRDSLGLTGDLIENFQLQPKKDLTNELLRVASDQGLIDVNNVDDLEKGFKDYFTSEEYRKLKQEVADNPEVFKRVAAAQSVKALTTAADITNTIANVIEQGPLGLVQKNNPKVAYIMRQFGIDEIAKEAFLCLTFGASAAAARVGRATSNALTSAAASIYIPPDLPKPAPISLPEVDFKQFKPFTISGDLWKQIEKALVDTVQQIVLEIIKQLADLLRENCPTTSPRSTDYGENDITSFINNNPNPQLEGLPQVGATSQLEQLSAKNGLSVQQTLDYLSALSSILSSIDICTLMLNRNDAPSDLLDKILDFNAEYSDTAVGERLDSITQILGFFEDLSASVDVTDLCNQIANELYALNQDNVCLDTGIFDDENIDELLRLIEDGLVIDLPRVQLECPDSEFLDPTIGKSVPETFNVLAETVQLQFIASGDSVKEIMLQPVQANESPMLSGIQYADELRGVERELGPGISPEFLEKIVSVLQDVKEGFDDLETRLEECDVDIARVLGTDQAAAIGTVSTMAGALTDASNDPNFRDAIQNVIDNIQGLDNQANIENPVFTTYKFNQNFVDALRDYIIPETFEYDPQTLQTLTQRFYSSYFIEPGAADEYKDLQLLFRFAEENDISVLPSLNESGQHFHYYVNVANDPNGLGYVIHQDDEAIFSPNNSTLTRQTAGLPANEYDINDFTRIDPPYTSNQLRYVTGHVSVNTSNNAISVYLSRNDLDDDEYTVLEEAQLFIMNQYPNAEMRNVVPQVRYQNYDVQYNVPTGPEFYGYQINGRLDTTIEAPQDGDGVHDIENGLYIGSHIHPGYPELGPATLQAPFAVDQQATSTTTAYQPLAENLENSFLESFASTGVGEQVGTPPSGFPNSLAITYPAKPADYEEPQLIADFNLQRFFLNNAEDEIIGGSKTATVSEIEYNDSSVNSLGDTANAFVYKFAEAIISELESPDTEDGLEVYYSDFPQAYGQLVDNAFDYVLNNGIFDAATLQSLNFFTQTENCPPSELGDLLDIDGIIQQMMDEYKEGCADVIPLSSKIRNVIKYGMYQLLVQVHIAEFIIKNIFVMSAYNIEGLLDRDSFVFTFIRAQVLQSLLAYFNQTGPQLGNVVRLDLVSYFNIKTKRLSVANQGGILYQDGTVAIPDGTEFSVTTEDTFFGFDEILDFMIIDRIDRSRLAINNALRKALPNTNQLSFDESVLRTLPGLTVETDTPEAISQILSSIDESSLTAEVLNIPEVGLMMTLRVENVYADNSTASEEVSQTYENLTTLQRQENNLAPIEYDISDFTRIDPPYTSNQLRYVTGHVSVNTSNNAISVYTAVNDIDDDEFTVLSAATAEVAALYPQYTNVEMRNVVAQVRFQYMDFNFNPPIPTGPEFYGYQINGRLDTTLEQPSTTETLEEILGDPIDSNRHFKLWFKKGNDVYLLIDLGYTPAGGPPEPPVIPIPPVEESEGLLQQESDPVIATEVPAYVSGP